MTWAAKIRFRILRLFGLALLNITVWESQCGLCAAQLLFAHAPPFVTARRFKCTYVDTLDPISKLCPQCPSNSCPRSTSQV